MPFSGNTDCHTSDVGHWFAMTKTDFVYSLNCETSFAIDYSQPPWASTQA